MLQATAFFGAGNIVAKDITGRVTSAADNEPLIGATVQVEGAQGGTITDFDGNYTIKANDGQTLVFTYIGYVTKKVKVKGNKIDVTLEEDGKSLEEVVVIGYGTMKKKLVTGATTQLKGDDIQKPNHTNQLTFSVLLYCFNCNSIKLKFLHYPCLKFSFYGASDQDGR